MKKLYISPSIVVETTALPAVMAANSVSITLGLTETEGGGDGILIMNSKYDGFDAFGSWDDDEED